MNKTKKICKEYGQNRYYSKNDKAKSKKNYDSNKGRLQEQARNSYWNLSEEASGEK